VHELVEPVDSLHPTQVLWLTNFIKST
jgi:hypothetical protein